MKKIRISVNYGNKRKSVTFDVPEEWQQHLMELDKQREMTDESPYVIEGTSSLKIKLTFFDYEQNY